MPRPVVDTVGRRFGRLLVKDRDGYVGREAAWACTCDCGRLKTISGASLRDGSVQSCGCLRKDKPTTHGMKGTPTYVSWCSMIQRCTNPNRPRFADHGGRGIKIYGSWLRFEAFLADMGERPEGKTLDRIDNDGDYEPDNCKWSTPTEQARNRRKAQSWKDGDCRDSPCTCRVYTADGGERDERLRTVD
jgi:hypothetical protein